MREDAPGSGYDSAQYADSLAEFGVPFRLPRSGARLLRRPIPGTDLHDAAGLYPVLACPAWEHLAADLSELRDVVSVVAVADPMSGVDAGRLALAFPDLVRPFKRHYVVDLGVPPDRRISANHRRNLRHVPRELRTERIDTPADRLDDWCRLYAVLVARHDVRGVAAFSAASFAAQFRVPGLRAWRAVIGDVTVGMVLWFVAGTVAYYHLTAADESGRRARCVFALVRHALEDLAAEGVQRADLGGAAGLTDDDRGGLASFKRGWSTATVDAHLCGRIVDREAYVRLTLAGGADSAQSAAYFPAYRAAPSRRSVRDDPSTEPVAV